MVQNIWYAISRLPSGLLFDPILLDFPIGYFCLPLGIRFLPSKHAIWSI